jgi:glycosyltransferase involved in cell wall biosynthesis
MTLALFFTRNVSLEKWVNQGLFDREKLIYEEHLKQGNLSDVYWFTYGSKDKKLSEQLKSENRLHKDIKIIEMPSLFKIPKIGSFIYSFMLPLIHKKILKKSVILKTNQMDGSWSAVISKWLFKKPLILRSGYTLSQLEYSKNGNNLKYNYYSLVEKFAYANCDFSVVTSDNNRKYLEDKDYISPNRVFIIENFIDINSFKPLNLKRYKNKILFVGRVSKEKNLYSLIKSISEMDMILDVYGCGELKEELKEYVNRKNIAVNFKGMMPNSELPYIYNKYKYYILPSYFEGMPKTLLEAMACGCICIGTNVNGINEIIEDGLNGFLSEGINYGDITRVIYRAFALSNSYIQNEGVHLINNKFSLESIVEKERMIFNKYAV